MRRGFLIISFILMTALAAHAQGFSSGSTGADGALDLSTMSCPQNSCEIQLPESGVFNFTTVNIPQGKELRFRNNSRNTPVTMLAQGQVTINGTINVSSVNFCPGGVCGCSLVSLGPGGFRGSVPVGFGPGGGTAAQPNGRWVGPLSLFPIVGGSGAYGAGDGGGAIIIASSSSIVLTGNVVAYGSFVNPCGGPIGSGGAIRLVANSMTVSGALAATGGAGGSGVIRLEAPLGQLSFTGSSNPAAVVSPINPVVVSSTPPVLTLISVGGYSVPSYAGQSFNTVDVLLPNQLSDPITVVVQGNNIPVGTQVSVNIVNGSPGATTTASPLQGTFQTSTASPTISNLSRGAVTYLVAYAEFEPPGTLQKFNAQGPDHIDKVRIETIIGAKPKYIFLRKDGSQINPEKLPKTFLQEFGM